MKIKHIANTVKPAGFVNLHQLTAVLALATGLLATGCSTTHHAHKANHAPPPTAKAQQQAITPAQALAQLEAGNARFVAGQSQHHNWPKEVAATAGGQYPVAIVLSCVDSRASSEIIFDQGLGEIFNARIAGNIANDDIIGSMEFACKVAGAKLIAVVGHSHCGAIKGACSGAKLGNLTGLLDKIQPSVAAAKTKMPDAAATDGKFIEEVAELNVHHAMKQIREQSPVLKELIDSGAVGLVGGSYDLDTGKVVFFTH